MLSYFNIDINFIHSQNEGGSISNNLKLPSTAREHNVSVEDIEKPAYVEVSYKLEKFSCLEIEIDFMNF